MSEDNSNFEKLKEFAENENLTFNDSTLSIFKSIVNFQNDTINRVKTVRSQETIKDLFQQIIKERNFNFIVKDVSTIPHMNDLLILSSEFVITVEVKDKQNLTNSDYTKFKDDTKNINEKYPDLNVFGVLISINDNVEQTLSSGMFYFIRGKGISKQIIDMLISSIIQKNGDLNSKCPELKGIELQKIELENMINQNNNIIKNLKNNITKLEEQNFKLYEELKKISGPINQIVNREQLLRINELIKYVDGNKNFTVKRCKEILNNDPDFKKLRTKNDIIAFISEKKKEIDC
jgi:hypothetical protein